MPRKRKGERTDGRIQITLDIGYNAEGKRMRKYFYGQTRIEAERKKQAYLDKTNNTYSHVLTVSQWIDEYLKSYPPKANPVYSASTIVPYNRIKAEMGNKLISAVREIDLQRFVNSLADYSASTIAKQMQVLKKVFAKARKNKLITDDPAEDLIVPDGTKGTHRALTRGEIDLILCHYRKTGNVGIWVMLMLFAGLRRSEMLGLDWTSVDLSARTITVSQVGILSNNKIIVQHRTKTKAGTRIIPIVEPLFQALSSIPAPRVGFVCKSMRGHELTETAVNCGIKHFINTINRLESNQPLVQNGRRTDLHPESAPAFTFRCHDLRHTFCTLLYDSGVDVKFAAYLMGHSDITVTMKIYTHLSEQRKTASSELMLDYFKSLTSI